MWVHCVLHSVLSFMQGCVKSAAGKCLISVIDGPYYTNREQKYLQLWRFSHYARELVVRLVTVPHAESGRLCDGLARNMTTRLSSNIPRSDIQS